MTALPNLDFFDPDRDTDSSPQVVEIFRKQFPDLYRATDRNELKTSAGSAIRLGGDTLITYRSAIRRIYGNYFGQLDVRIQKDILSVLDAVSNTPDKRIQYWDETKKVVINNHQLGNMMPFPSGTPSLNSIRAVTENLYDYFDRFLAEVRKYYAESANYRPTSQLQAAIYYYRGYFDFFQTYDKFVEENLLQDFVNNDLWAITDFREYVRAANEIIDSRGMRFTVSKEHH